MTVAFVNLVPKGSSDRLSLEGGAVQLSCYEKTVDLGILNNVASRFAWRCHMDDFDVVSLVDELSA